MGIDDVFAVIAEGTRRQILEHLRDGDKAVGELVVELQVSQPTVSKHLKVLREAGLVTMRAQGQKRYYSLDTAPLGLVGNWLAAFDGQGAQPDASVGQPVDVGLQIGAGAGSAQSSAGGRVAEPVVEPDAERVAEPAAEPAAGPDAEPVVVSDAVAEAGAEGTDGGVLADAVLAGPEAPTGADTPRPPIGRTMGRAAERAVDLLAQLRRRRDPSS